METRRRHLAPACPYFTPFRPVRDELFSRRRDLSEGGGSRVDEELGGGEEGVVGGADAEAAEAGLVAGCEHMGEVHLAVAQVGEAFECGLGGGVGGGADGEGDEGLVEVEGAVFAFEDALFHVGDGGDGGGGEEVAVLWDAGEALDGVEDGGGGGVEVWGVLALDDGAVGQFEGRAAGDAFEGVGEGGVVGGLAGGDDDGAVLGGEPELVHEALDDLDGVLVGGAFGDGVGEVAEVAANDLLAGGVLAGGVVNDAGGDAVDAHVGGAFVGALAGGVEAGPDLAEDGEGVDVAVVIDGDFAVGLEVEGVDHVDVAEVGGGGLVGEIDRVLEGEVPDGEGLELGVAGGAAGHAVVVEHGEAGGELAGAGAGAGDDDDGAGGLDVGVGAVALGGDDEVEIGGVAGDGAVERDGDAAGLKLVAELERGGLAVETGDDHGADVDAPGAEGVDELEGVVVVGDAEVRAHFLALDVLGVDAEDDLGLVAEGAEEAEFGVGVVTGEDAGGVVVEHQFAAEFEVEFVAEGFRALHEALGLLAQVGLVVESDFPHGVTP